MPTRTLTRPLVVGLTIAAITLGGCSKHDTTALDATDRALAGQQVDGNTVPIVSRVVMVGKAGRDKPLCASTATPKSGALSVHWSNLDGPPPKASVTGNVAVCDSDGDWSGIVFPTPEGALDDCNVTGPATSPHEYQGPCRWGWVKTSDLTIAAR